MANPEHVVKLREGSNAWNSWVLKQGPLFSADLRGAHLSEAELGGAHLRGADLRGALLSTANLIQADLRGANLSRAGLRFAYLKNADLTGAHLSEAKLEFANLSNARLAKTDWHEVSLYETVLANVDLGNATGLDECRHRGPSVLDYRTLSKSGTLPLAFLRGCGLPETLIEYLPSIFGQAIQFHSCFISYSTLDQEFASRIHEGLQNKGIRCWFAPHDMRGGKKHQDQIDQAIQVHDRLLLILSPESIKSDWVKGEIMRARKKEAEQKRDVLFPIRLVDMKTIKEWDFVDPKSGTDIAAEILKYHLPDFSNWKDHDSFTKAFNKLLRDLKDEEMGAGRQKETGS